MLAKKIFVAKTEKEKNETLFKSRKPVPSNNGFVAAAIDLVLKR